MSTPLTPFVVIFSLFFVSCVHRSENSFRKKFKSWEGRSEEELVQSFGYPSQHHTSPEGHRVYEYVSSRTYIEDSWPFHHYRHRFSRRQVYSYFCVVWFELHHKKVQKVTWRGNDCLAEDP